MKTIRDNNQDLTLFEIIETINGILGINIRDEIQKRDTYVYGRAVYYLISRREMPFFTLESIGVEVGKNHCAVIHGLKKANETYLNDPIFLTLLEETLSRLGLEGLAERDTPEAKIWRSKRKTKKQVERLIDIVRQLRQENRDLKHSDRNRGDAEYKRILGQIPPDKIPEFFETRVKPYVKMLGV